jgi:indolepyruvate decarboxylase
MPARGHPFVRETVQSSDCLLAVGYRSIDVTSGVFSDSLPRDTIQARAYSVDVDGETTRA